MYKYDTIRISSQLTSRSSYKDGDAAYIFSPQYLDLSKKS